MRVADGCSTTIYHVCPQATSMRVGNLIGAGEPARYFVLAQRYPSAILGHAGLCRPMLTHADLHCSACIRINLVEACCTEEFDLLDVPDGPVV